VSAAGRGKLDQVRVDYKLPIAAWGEGSYVKFGAKYLERDKFTDANGHVLRAAPARPWWARRGHDPDRL
jgi:hypothetical protein